MKKRLLILALTLAAAACLAVGITACGTSDESVSQDTQSESTARQAPVYQGMVISSAAKAVSLSADGSVSGDVYTGDDRINPYDPFDDGSPTIEEEIEAEFGVSGTGKSVYYADPGEDIYVTVKLSNPSKYEIMSFVLNGEKYSSYMFESGSDLENLIVKLNVGTKEGFTEYTIDEIKYVDGTEIKEAILDGDTTVKCGVRTESVPYTTVSEEVSLSEISLEIKLTDLHHLITASDGYCLVALYDGEYMTICAEEISEGTNYVTFGTLMPDTVYQYAVFALFDDMTGDGAAIHYLYTDTLRTEAMVLFDDVEVTKTGVSFGFVWYEGYDDSYLHTKFTLESADGKILGQIDPNSREITGLYSGTEYTLNVAYTGIYGETESIRLTFTTTALETPEVGIRGLSSTDEGITYEISVTDGDGTGSISSVTLYRDGEEVSSSVGTVGRFEGLYSDNEYTLTVIYTYDLNDGEGERTLEVSSAVRTLAKTLPEVTFDFVTSSKTGIEYSVTVSDPDGLGSVSSVTLRRGEETVTTLTELSGSVTGLLSDNEYTITVVYAYDANDGAGERTLSVSESVRTEAMATPEITANLSSTKTEVGYLVVITDEDGTGAVSSVTLEGPLGVSYAGTETERIVTELLSDNEYTLTVVYTYDLNDDAGDRALEAVWTVTTLAMETPTVGISSLTATKTEISYVLEIEDSDETGEVSSVTLTLGDGDTLTPEDGVFAGLLSDNTYTLTVVYAYDLNDGEGERTIVLSEDIKTLAMAAPSAEIVLVEKGANEMTFGIIFTDEDGTGTIVSVDLYSGGNLVETTGGAFTGEITYVGLAFDTMYTIVVSYEFDLNDGTGTQSGGTEMSTFNDVMFAVNSTVVLNTSAVCEDETIIVRADLYNPGGVTFTEAVINGVTYDVSDLSTSSRLIVEILYEDQFVGGDTLLTLSEMTCVINGKTYSVGVYTDNTASVFVNGTFSVGDFSVVRFDDMGREEETEYAFKSETVYYRISVDNATGYDVYSVTINGTVYSEDKISMSEDRLSVYVAVPDTGTGAWYSRSLTSISYRNEGIDRTRIVSFTTSYLRLKSDDVVEVSTYEDLLNMNGWQYYRLVNDIDLAGMEWVNMSNYMYGVFDGNGYTISNVMAATTFENKALYLGLFYNMQGIVMNLDVCDVLYIVTVENTTGNSYAIYAGGLSAQSEHVTIKNCNISSSFRISNNGKGNVYVGAISGNGSSDTEIDTVLCDMNAIVYYVSSYYCTGYLGNDTNIYIFDSTCDYSLTVDDIKTDYDIYLDGYMFTFVDGEYTLVKYVGKNTELVLPDRVNGSKYSIGEEAFYRNSSIVNVVISEGVEEIGVSAFESCSSLESVVISDSVTAISRYAFYNCSSLKSLTIGKGVTSIGYSAFNFCDSLENIYFDAESLSDFTSTTTIFGYYTGDDAKSLTLTVGKDVTRIPAYFFYGNYYITDLVFEDGGVCTKIGERAFYNCYGLTSVTIPEKVTSVGTYAFYQCTALEEVYFNAASMSNLSYYNYVFYKAGQEGKGITVTVGAGVKKIPAYLFYGLDSKAYPSVVTLVFEEGSQCTNIGECAFSCCNELACVTIPESVTTFGWGAFSSCPLLETIYFNAVAAEDLDSTNSVFHDVGRKTNGTTLYVGAKVTRIPAYLFYPSYIDTAVHADIAEVVFEDGCVCESVGAYAFYQCDKLGTIFLPSSVTTIGEYAFYGCTALTGAVAFGDVSSVGDYAFYGCSKLAGVYFVGDVISIGDYAFSGTYISELLLLGSVEHIGAHAIESSRKMTIYYYGTAEDWGSIDISSDNTFTDSATIYFYSEDEPTEDGNFWHYEEGILVVPW